MFRAAVYPRDELLAQVAYYGGARTCELALLRWRHVNHDKQGRGVLHLHTDDGRERHVVVPAWLYVALQKHRGRYGAELPVFANLDHAERPLSTRQVHRIIVAIAQRAAIAGDVSPRWLRRAHRAHALDRVRQRVGLDALDASGHPYADDTSALLPPPTSSR